MQINPDMLLKAAALLDKTPVVGVKEAQELVLSVQYLSQLAMQAQAAPGEDDQTEEKSSGKKSAPDNK